MSNDTRVSAGVPTGGQFAASAKGESNVTLAASQTVTETDKAAEHISRFPMVYFVDRNDELTQNEIDDYLSGDSSTAYDSAEERFDESIYRNAVEEAEQAWGRAYEAGDVTDEWDSLDNDGQDEFRYLVMEKDDTDLVADLANNTPDQLMRSNLSTNLSERLNTLSPGAWNGLATFNEDSAEADARRQARHDLVADVLAAHGVNDHDPKVVEAIRELVENGPYDWHEGVSLDVIFYDDVTTAAADTQPGSTTSLAFTDAHVVLIDTYGGSGHDVKIPGALTRTFAPMPEDGGLAASDRVFTDTSDAAQMSWNSVCGLHKPAYRTPVARTVTPADTDQRVSA